jgi:hypothetical protein
MGNPTMVPNQPLGAPQDPRSQYLAAAIQALQNRGAGGSPTSMGEGLLSQMILQKAYQQNNQQQQQANQGPASLGGNMAAQGASATGPFGMGTAAPPPPPVGNTMAGQMNPLAAQQGQPNSWPFG